MHRNMMDAGDGMHGEAHHPTAHGSQSNRSSEVMVFWRCFDTLNEEIKV